jgi:hypothetical protein
MKINGVPYYLPETAVLVKLDTGLRICSSGKSLFDLHHETIRSLYHLDHEPLFCESKSEARTKDSGIQNQSILRRPKDDGAA